MVASRLGLREEAAWHVHDRYMLSFNQPEQRAQGHLLRWPGFYGVMVGDQNWFPDAEQSDQAATSLQWMLLQNDGRRILLFPSWPRSWPDVDFKLAAWYNTTVTVSCRNGVSRTVPTVRQ